MFIMNVSFAQTEAEGTQTVADETGMTELDTTASEPVEKEPSKYEKAVLANKHISDEEKQQLLEYLRNNPDNLLEKTSDERKQAIDQIMENQRNYLSELDHQKELFGSRADRNDQMYNSIKNSLELHDKKEIERPDANATPEEKISYQNKLKAQLEDKKALLQSNMKDMQNKVKGMQSFTESFDHLKDENGKLDMEGLKEELDSRTEEALGEMLQGDQKTACEVILCLTSSQRPNECTPPINEYILKSWRYTAHGGIDWGSTMNARSGFLQQCPATDEDQELSALAEGHARLGESCNLALYNTPTRTIYYNALDPLSEKKPDHNKDILSITVIDSAIHSGCKAYIENEYMDLYLTPFRKYHDETLTMYESPFNPKFDDPKDKRRPVTKPFAKVWDLERGEFFEFGSWYYEKPLEF